jgi:hypothetical protein
MTNTPSRSNESDHSESNYLRPLLAWTFHPHADEPAGLNRSFWIGVIVIVVGSTSAVFIGAKWPVTIPPTFSDHCRCQAQQTHRLEREEKIKSEIKASELRIQEFQAALIDQNSPSHVAARTALTLEEQVKKDLERKQQSVDIETLEHYLPKLIIALGLTVLLALAAARLATWHAIEVLGSWSPRGNSKGWKKPYALFVTLIFVAHTTREVITSVLQTENKSWFAWSSFCVSSAAWTAMLVIAVGVAMVVAYTLTVLWHFGRSSVRPTLLDPDHSDGRWGVGRYLMFLQTWTLMSLVFLVFPIALWLRTVRNDSRISPAYLLAPLVLFAAGLVISGRMIRNAVAIRRLYETQLGQMGNTWREIKERDLPPDPTISLLGENWLKLPTVIAGIFTFLWLILVQFGVSDFLLDLTGIR